MDITYDYYRIFYYVAKYKSFTHAAQILMSSQPNVTRSMNNLEKQLGVKLFNRSNRGVTLTAEGKMLYEHVSIAFEQLRTAEDELLNGNGLSSGSITISASETALHVMLLPVLKDFHSAYPQIHIRIQNHSTQTALDSLRNGVADLAVVTTPTHIRRPLKETKLRDFREVCVCGRRYEFLSRSRHHLSELTEYPYISLAKDTMTYEFFTEYFYHNGIDMQPDIEVATADQLPAVLLCDLGYGFVPEVLLETHAGKDRLYEIPLYEEVPLRSICMVEDTGRTLTTAAAELKKMLLASSGPQA